MTYYKPYSKYKTSQYKWIGDIPEHWDAIPLGHYAYIKGRIGWQGLKFEEFTDEGPFLVTGVDFIAGKIDWQKSYHITFERYSEAPEIHLHKDDLLITKDGTIGKLAYIDELPGPASLNSHLLIIRPVRKKFINVFLYWVLSSNSFFSYTELSQDGTIMPSLSQEKINSFRFGCPSLAEQKSIAEFLNRETGKIDDLIGKRERLIALLQEKRAAVISHAVTKGLDPNVKLKSSGIDWLGDIPEHWEVKKLKYLAHIRTGNTPTKNDESNYDTDGMMWIKPDNLSEFFPIEESKEYLSPTGIKIARCAESHTIFVCCIGTIGKFGFAHKTVAFNQQINAVIFSDLISKEYRIYLICASKQEHIKNSNINVVAILNGERQQCISFPIPPRIEQQAITVFLENQTARIDSLIAKEKKIIEKMKEYRVALISAAVTGKIDVRGEQ